MTRAADTNINAVSPEFIIPGLLAREFIPLIEANPVPR
jgi:hypothetical protein